MPSDNVFTTISDRMPWTIAARAFRASGIPLSMGWNKTIARLDKSDDESIKDRVRDLLKEHAECGEKFTKFYRITGTQKEMLLRALSNIEVEESVFSSAFPCKVDPAEFRGVKQPQVLVARQLSEDGVALIFTSEMKITSKEVISDSEEFTEFQEKFREFDEIVGLRLKSVQLFNVVWVSHHDNVAEIRVDSPSGIPHEALHQIHSVIRSMVNGLVGQEALPSAYDLFPLIESIYEDETEGKVVELGFTTSTGSVKLEKMRRTRTCLREELYHVGGKNALETKISPYRVSVAWEFGTEEMPYSPELTLSGTSRGRHSLSAADSVQQINGATISNCIGRIDYEYVRAKIIAHMSRIEAKANDAMAAE